MADDESFLLINLKEDKAKELAQVIGSDSCRRILDYLTTKKKATESDIAKDLKQPLSTVHYNLQNLYKAGLVVAEEYHYSEKGKEVNHYSLAKRIIIIAPEEKSGFMDKLKKVLPLTIFAVVGAGLIQVYSWLSRSNFSSGKMMAESASYAVQDNIAAKTGGVAVTSLSTGVQEQAANQTQIIVEKYVYVTQNVPSNEPSIAFWFLVGSMTIIIFILIMSLFRKK